MPTLLLIRHGRTSANTAGVLAGWTPGVSLDDTGVTQARALAERLADVPFAAVVASPLQRTVETARVPARRAAPRAWPARSSSETSASAR